MCLNCAPRAPRPPQHTGSKPGSQGKTSSCWPPRGKLNPDNTSLHGKSHKQNGRLRAATRTLGALLQTTCPGARQAAPTSPLVMNHRHHSAFSVFTSQFRFSALMVITHFHFHFSNRGNFLMVQVINRQTKNQCSEHLKG